MGNWARTLSLSLVDQIGLAALSSLKIATAKLKRLETHIFPEPLGNALPAAVVACETIDSFLKLLTEIVREAPFSFFSFFSACDPT